MQSDIFHVPIVLWTAVVLGQIWVMYRVFLEHCFYVNKLEMMFPRQSI